MRERRVLRRIVEQHGDELSFLWSLREAAVRSPQHSLRDLGEIDQRIEAHLDGLVIAGGDGWELCVRSLRQDEPGELFALTLIALAAGDGSHLAEVLDRGEACPSAQRGICAAFGWTPPSRLRGTVSDLLASPVAFQRYVGLVTCAIQRLNSDSALAQALRDPVLQARAFRAIGEVGRRDLLVGAQGEAGALADDTSRFWATWSAGRLGARDVVGPLKAFVESGSAFAARALMLVTRLMRQDEAIGWIRTLAHSAGHIRAVIKATGYIGEAAAVPWLIKQMRDQEYARLAGEAFTNISGVDLERDGLADQRPEAWEDGPKDDPDDPNVDMSEDQDLAWPNVKRVAEWWENHGSGFKSGTRYFLGGSADDVGHVESVLRWGYQRQRAAAALELAIRRPAEPVFEVRAPAARQANLLGITRGSAGL